MPLNRPQLSHLFLLPPPACNILKVVCKKMCVETVDKDVEGKYQGQKIGLLSVQDF